MQRIKIVLYHLGALCLTVLAGVFLFMGFILFMLIIYGNILIEQTFESKIMLIGAYSFAVIAIIWGAEYLQKQAEALSQEKNKSIH